MHLLFADGDHEDHDRLNGLPIDSDTALRKITNHIRHLPRGYRWKGFPSRFGARVLVADARLTWGDGRHNW
jgi:hypothetical protein